MNRRTVVVAVVSVVALNVAVLVGALLDRSEVVEGPAGSSYVTAPDGVAAWYELLRRRGVDVRRLRLPVDASTLADAGTFVVVEPGVAAFAPSELDALRRFVEDGGTVVVAGNVDAATVERLVDFDPGWDPAGDETISPWGAPPGGPGEVRAAGFGSWDRAGPGLPVLGGARPVALTFGVGDGIVHLVADGSVFANWALAYPGNARYAAGVVGDGPVVFDEFRHGYTEARSALPAAWRRTWPLLAFVVLVGLYAAGRRLVPAQETTRDLGPGRERYVESVAGLLVRAGDPTATLPALRAEARRLVATRAGVAADADADRLEHAARRLGLDSRTVAAIMGGDDDTETLLAVHRAVASLRTATTERVLR